MNMNSSKSTISKKHLIAIAVVLAIGVGAGTFILQGGGKPKAAATEDLSLIHISEPTRPY